MVSNVSETTGAAPGYRPRIALTTYYQEGSWGVWNSIAAIVPGAYVEGVVAAGGTPVLLPPVGTDPSVLELVDGLIVIGGVDVDPQFYGADRHERTFSQPFRDEHDIALTRAALEQGLPLFAICRGAQILNVALGGTLIQHLPDVNENAAQYQPGPGQYGRVEFTTEPGSRCAQLLGETAESPCYHHQALETVADGLVVTARAADGTIEAVETTTESWTLGVQFHPEENRKDPRLFEGFIDVARRFAHERDAGHRTDHDRKDALLP
ncbi:gamma-glutamyl-gamma-aminobutyrate hydrolase family protein [Micrococcus luteus]|nr:gamma-glutamyl-gamma-aminobutyrate hydrolase family protein [Micrococcus luteus]MCV7487850.1 gamma-glutamyl-gamma-aminobutyrate hydrolase family protein [Micrococcus luteus]MCV7600383.1 gamma-glutamyl-gamma-aminobutyrate hydrolase family protein [Micrococcus luteus]MCV7601691.1 gamma-glutamyl-gamma-aminobutyrate hydrolase family protein [Micrococcus luteus]MCV7697076.1 gamma-glutamyl-gamma-aminobutyrate hydrolase family protein [Micrococcus luteus]